MKVTPRHEIEAYQNKDGQSFLEWQPTALQKAELANGRIIIGDVMGLGKMVIRCRLLALHPELLPALVLCTARIRWQWWEHLVKWSVNGSGRPTLIPQVLEDGTASSIPYTDIFNVVVTSYDGLWRQQWMSEKKMDKWGQKEEYVFKKDVTYPFKSLILDEFQLIKNTDAVRTKAARLTAKQVKYIVGTSGTPVKNNATEFFVPLNMISLKR